MYVYIIHIILYYNICLHSMYIYRLQRVQIQSEYIDSLRVLIALTSSFLFQVSQINITSGLNSIMLPSEVSTFFQDWKAKETSFQIMVIGDCGSGKTTLVNNLQGEEIAQEQAPSILSTFQGIFQGVPVIVHETSGLENPDAEGDKEFKEELCALLCGGKLDVIIYCLKANETRIRNSLIHSLQRYTNMGLYWRKAVIALTLANSFPITAGEKKATSFTVANLFKSRVDNFTRKIKHAGTQA